MKPPVMHFHGERDIAWPSGRRRMVTVMRGWALCCTADIARAVRAQGRSTSDRSRVTCKTCLRLLALADNYKAA